MNNQIEIRNQHVITLATVAGAFIPNVQSHWTDKHITYMQGIWTGWDESGADHILMSSNHDQVIKALMDYDRNVLNSFRAPTEVITHFPHMSRAKSQREMEYMLDGIWELLPCALQCFHGNQIIVPSSKFNIATKLISTHDGIPF